MADGCVDLSAAQVTARLQQLDDALFKGGILSQVNLQVGVEPDQGIGSLT